MICLDSWAVLAWLDGDEPAAAAAAEVFDRERPVVSWINLPGVSSMRAVARLEAERSIALADCFAISLAAENEAIS